MLIARINGGLGNQLFQYATARAISIQLNRKLYLDNSWYRDIQLEYDNSSSNTTTKRDYLLNYFNIQSPIIKKVHLKWIKRLEFKSKYSIFYKILRDGPLSKFSFDKIDPSNFSLAVINKLPRVYLTGYWQNNDIIDEYKNIISSDLILKYPISENNEFYLKSINSTNSIAIHFRRGDYLSDPRYRKIYATCSNDYYQNGIKQIKKINNDVHLFIFSDDIKWVKNNYNFITNTTYINNAGPEYEHLFLMSQCKHQITANSTFSWWAAWLNTYPKKVTITPKYWYYDKHLNETVTRIPQKWIKIDNLK